MKRIPVVLAILVGVATVPAIAQQLQQPIAPANKPVPTQRRMGPELQLAQPAQVSKLATDPSQRPQSSSPIPSAGPAKQVPAEQTALVGQKNRASVFDSAGKPVNGMIQIAPNRVYDTTTGLYHWTRTEGQQQKLID
ncbi:MAG: hypothetical protein ABI538_05105 [Pseudoxanthomonas sp.]